MRLFCYSGRRGRNAIGNGRAGRRRRPGRRVVLAGRRHAHAPGDGVQPGRAGTVADIPGGADRRVRDQREAGDAHVPRGARAHRVLSVQRRPRGRHDGTVGHRLRGPADRRPQRGGRRKHHQEPRGGIFRQTQLPVSVRGVDVARRNRQQAGERGRSL